MIDSALIRNHGHFGVCNYAASGILPEVVGDYDTTHDRNRGGTLGVEAAWR